MAAIAVSLGPLVVHMLVPAMATCRWTTATVVRVLRKNAAIRE